ncbi:MAG: hypothetical protein C4523_15755 [Myxococcales bacterium]|nr:MAG: hypothetical protein C4523_15755 [Myxococcales bacterium]
MSTSLTSKANSLPAMALPDSLLTELAGLRALDHLDREDRPLPTLAFNTKFQLPDGSWARKDVFVNSLTEEVKPEIRAVLLHLKKTRRYAVYTEGSGFDVKCESDDLAEGVTHDGEVVDCSTCSHKSWGNGHGRDAAPKCGVIYHLLGIDLDDGSPFLLRAKATSLRPVQRYLARYFLGKLKLADGSYADLPLFTHQTKLSLMMPTGTYAVLNMENAGACTETEIRTYKSLYENLRGIGRIDPDDDLPENGGGEG